MKLKLFSSILIVFGESHPDVAMRMKEAVKTIELHAISTKSPLNECAKAMVRMKKGKR